jgi:hypothetical protein
MADSPVRIQAISRSEPSTPSWFGEVVLILEYLRKHGILTGESAITCYLKAYQLSSEHTLLRLDGQYGTGAVLADVVELYLHRGAFEPMLSDEDQEIDPDRWCSHAACGQEA